MNIKQIQNLLSYLGYYVGNIDGDWGDLSKTACTAFQKDFGGISVDGYAGSETQKALKHAVAYDMFKTEPVPDEENVSNPDTGTFWDDIQYFDRSEFKCTCGGRGCNGFPAEPAEQLVRNAEAARKHFGRVANVSSGVRCQLRNSELPGSAANSLHMRGKAMDFSIRGIGSETLLAYVRTLPEVDEAYAIDGSYVHMGVLKY